MRSLAPMLVLILIGGCVTYEESQFFRPSGPGTTVKVKGVPDTQQVLLGEAGYVRLNATLAKSVVEVSLFIAVKNGHNVRLLSNVFIESCTAASPHRVTMEKAQAWRIRDGVGYFAYPDPMDKVVGDETFGGKSTHGDLSVGQVLFTAHLNGCGPGAITLEVPPIEVDGHSVAVGKFVLRPDRGRFVNVLPIA